MVWLALVAAISSAAAAPVTVGGASINLPTPNGFCELSPSNAADNRLITTFGDLLAKSGNKLLGYSADCGQLTAWRASKQKFLDDYSMYQTTIGQMVGSAPAPEPVNQTCATLRAEGEKMLSNATPDIKARAENAIKDVKINEMRFIGVLAEDPNACYSGLIQNLHNEAAGADKTQLNLFAVTNIKGKTIFVYRFAVYASSDTVTDVLAKLKENVAALYAAN